MMRKSEADNSARVGICGGIGSGLRLICFMCLTAFVFSLVAHPSAFAAGVDDKKKELNNVQKNIKDKQAQLKKLKKKQRSVLSELNTIEGNMVKTQRQISSLSNQLQVTQNNIVVTQKNLEKAQQELTKQSGIMHERMMNVYINGRVSYIEVLLNSGSYSDFLNRVDFVKAVSRQDITIFQKVKALKLSIEKRKAELVSQQKRIQQLKSEQQQKHLAYQQSASERTKLLANINKDKKTLEAAIDEMERIASQLNSVIRQMTAANPNSPKKYSGGAMSYPVGGRMTSPFGWRIHPIFKTRKFHSGIDIAAPSGTPIKAAAAGTVIYSGWITGYGNAVIIDHGGGITSLYGHNSSLVAGKGSQVSKGQVIAKCGSTGYSTGPHCHFEVRKNGQAVNPMGYL